MVLAAGHTLALHYKLEEVEYCFCPLLTGIVYNDPSSHMHKPPPKMNLHPHWPCACQGEQRYGIERWGGDEECVLVFCVCGRGGVKC